MEWNWEIKKSRLECEAHGYLVALLLDDNETLLLVDSDVHEGGGFYHVFKNRERLNDIEKWLDENFISEFV